MLRANRVNIAVAISVLLLMLGTMPAWARTIHVAKTGSDSGNGSVGAPYLTINKGASVAVAGDTVLVAPGKYTELVRVGHSGTGPSAQVVFRADISGGDSVVVLGTLGDSNASNYVFNVDSRDWVTIRDFRIRGGYVGIHVGDGRHVSIIGCSISNATRFNILGGCSPAMRVINCTIWECQTSHGAYIGNPAADSCLFYGNVSYNNAKAGLKYNGDCTVGCGTGGCDYDTMMANVTFGNGENGLQLISFSNGYVANNVVYDNVGKAVQVSQETSACPSSNNVFINNTIISNDSYAMFITDANDVNNVYFNNVLMTLDPTHTLFYDASSGPTYRSNNYEARSWTGVFTDPANGNFTADKAGPLIDAGIGSYRGFTAPGVDFAGTTRPQGAAWDIGAYEYAAGSSDTSPPTVSITSPQDGATVSGTITVQVNATDNVRVAGVRLRVDGNVSGIEDTQAPFNIQLDTSGLSDGPHVLTATARDPSNNTATSSAVDITVDNSGFITSHPRMLLTGNRLAGLMTKACRDANGNPIANCTPTADWTRFFNLVTQYKTSGSYYAMAPWHFALAYMVTKDTAFADRAVQLADAEVAAGVANVRTDSYLYARYALRDIGWVFDWCYDFLTPTQRTSYIDFMNEVCYEIWNPDNPTAPWSGWGTDNPTTGYFWNFLLATAYDAICTYGENPQAATYLSFLYDKLDSRAIPYLDSYGKGGGWHDGNFYSWGAKRYLVQLFEALERAGGRNYFQMTDFPRDCVYMMLYAGQPDNNAYYGGGDIADPNQTGGFIDTARWMMLLLAKNLSGTTESQYAQYWVNHVYTTMSAQEDYPVDFLWSDPSLSEQSWNSLPLSYYAEGYGFVNSRSSWATDATSVDFVSTERVATHENRNQNSFSIFKNGWQVMESNVFGGGYAQDTKNQNTFLFNGMQQDIWGIDNGVYRYDKGVVTKYENKPDYAYVAGDASGAYNTRTDSVLDYYERELVHLRPDYVVIFDRARTKQASYTKQWLMHTRNQPTITGNELVAQNGEGKLFAKSLLPLNASITPVNENSEDASLNSWRIEIEPTDAVRDHTFLTMIYAADASAASMPPTVQATTETLNMVGVRVTDAQGDKVIMFSTDPLGAPVSSPVRYTVSLNESTNNLLIGMLPDTEYRVHVWGEGDRQVVEVSQGPGTKASHNGVLEFTTPPGVVPVAMVPAR